MATKTQKRIMTRPITAIFDSNRIDIPPRSRSSADGWTLIFGMVCSLAVIAHSLPLTVCLAAYLGVTLVVPNARIEEGVENVRQ